MNTSYQQRKINASIRDSIKIKIKSVLEAYGLLNIYDFAAEHGCTQGIVTDILKTLKAEDLCHSIGRGIWKAGMIERKVVDLPPDLAIKFGYLPEGFKVPKGTHHKEKHPTSELKKKSHGIGNGSYAHVEKW